MDMRIGRMVGLSLALALAGCGDDDGFSPTVETVAGSYAATVFTLDVGAAVVNQLVLGADVAVVLAPDGTTTGHLFVPGAGTGGADLDADLAGTWSLNRGAVTFDQAADTFLRDVRFTADRGRLIGEDFAGHQIIHLTLSKNGAGTP